MGYYAYAQRGKEALVGKQDLANNLDVLREEGIAHVPLVIGYTWDLRK